MSREEKVSEGSTAGSGHGHGTDEPEPETCGIDWSSNWYFNQTSVVGVVDWEGKDPSLTSCHAPGQGQEQLLCQLTHDALVQRLIEAEREIEELRRDQFTASGASLVSIIQQKRSVTIKEAQKEWGQADPSLSLLETKEADVTESEFRLCPSPIITSPPYEHIYISQSNKTRMLLYMNPKLAFGPNILKGQGSGTTNVWPFQKSDVDLEMRGIISKNPPNTHKIVRKKSRRERGSSVPSVDSYYGTVDLAKVGHASYFIPTLNRKERAAIGWKSQYRYGKWKYSNDQPPRVLGRPQQAPCDTAGSSIESIADPDAPRKCGIIINSIPTDERENFFDTDSTVVSANPSVLMSTVHTIRRLIVPKRNLLRRLIPCLGKLRNPDWDEQDRMEMEDRQVCTKWTGASAVGGDIVLEDRSSAVVFGPQRPPPPLLMPVLGGRDQIWFLGSKVPPDHQVLLEDLRRRMTQVTPHVHFQEKQAEVGSEPEVGIKLEVGIEPEVGSEPEAGSEPEVGSEPEAWSQAADEAEPEPSSLAEDGVKGQGNELEIQKSDIENMNHETPSP